MKPFVCLIALVFTTFCLQAQTEKGRFMLSLHNFSPLLSESTLLAPTNTFGIAFGKDKDEFAGQEFERSFTTIGLETSGHYFIIDNLSVGLNLGFFSQMVTDEDDDEQTLSSFMVGPEVRYYIPVGSNGAVYLRGGASFGNYTYKFNGEQDGDPVALTQYGGGAGYSIFFGNSASINIGAGYGANIAKNETEVGDFKSTTSAITIDVGFSIFLGGTE